MKGQSEQLRERLGRALANDRYWEASDLLSLLMRIEPQNARWPHRRGDVLRRLGHTTEALTLYEQAVGLYVQEGFFPRAAALARQLVALDPARLPNLMNLHPFLAQQWRGVVSGTSESTDLPQLTDDIVAFPTARRNEPPEE